MPLGQWPAVALLFPKRRGRGVEGSHHALSFRYFDQFCFALYFAVVAVLALPRHARKLRDAWPKIGSHDLHAVATHGQTQLRRRTSNKRNNEPCCSHGLSSLSSRIEPATRS